MKVNKGFSLLEMSFVILISGLIMTAILNLIPILHRTSETSLNIKKLDYIENAFYAFIYKNKRLPIPADIQNTLVANTSTFAVEQDVDNIKKEEDNFYIGMLPVIDLGLSPNYAYDGFNNKIVYIVNKNCTKTNGLLECDKNNLLKINTNNTITENVIFAIISQGYNKNYSIRRGQSTQKTSNSSNEEKYNSYEFFNKRNNDKTIYSNLYTNMEFDDKVIFATKDFILNKLNMYDIGCKFNINDDNIINAISNKCSTTPAISFPNLSGIYYLDYRETKESDIYVDSENNYKCILECGSSEKINVYKININN